MDQLFFTLIIGIGATAITDIWALVRNLTLRIPLPDYGLVGRWFAHMAYGRFRHESIKASRPMAGERLIGWLAHYVIGVAFAAVLVGLWGQAWLQHPTIGPALIVGIGTLAAPFFLMQPGMGSGIAASRTPNPTAARLQSVVTHAVFGFGLYASAWAVRALCMS